jgi:hypothetical protein
VWRDCTDDGVGIVAVLIEDSKRERNMSMIPHYLYISMLTSNLLSQNVSLCGSGFKFKANFVV